VYKWRTVNKKREMRRTIEYKIYKSENNSKNRKNNKINKIMINKKMNNINKYNKYNNKINKKINKLNNIKINNNKNNNNNLKKEEVEVDHKVLLEKEKKKYLLINVYLLLFPSNNHLKDNKLSLKIISINNYHNNKSKSYQKVYKKELKLLKQSYKMTSNIIIHTFSQFMAY
jgi:hypothetical protein